LAVQLAGQYKQSELWNESCIIEIQLLIKTVVEPSVNIKFYAIIFVKYNRIGAAEL